LNRQDSLGLIQAIVAIIGVMVAVVGVVIATKTDRGRRGLKKLGGLIRETRKGTCVGVHLLSICTDGR